MTLLLVSSTVSELRRVSSVSSWLACERMALQSPQRRSREHIAAWVGTLAHAALAEVDPPETPDRFRFDRVTPLIGHATVQARAIAAEAKRVLLNGGWSIIRAEQHVHRDGYGGHYDLLAYHEANGDAIVDLKTGGRVSPSVWYQVGGYLDLYAAGVRHPAPWGGVLHVPRVAVGKATVGSLEVRSSDGLVDAWRRYTSRVDLVMSGARPFERPGVHCRGCTVTACPVRVHFGNVAVSPLPVGWGRS